MKNIPSGRTHRCTAYGILYYDFKFVVISIVSKVRGGGGKKGKRGPRLRNHF